MHWINNSLVFDFLSLVCLSVYLSLKIKPVELGPYGSLQVLVFHFLLRQK